MKLSRNCVKNLKQTQLVSPQKIKGQLKSISSATAVKNTYLRLFIFLWELHKLVLKLKLGDRILIIAVYSHCNSIYFVMNWQTFLCRTWDPLLEIPCSYQSQKAFFVVFFPRFLVQFWPLSLSGNGARRKRGQNWTRNWGQTKKQLFDQHINSFKIQRRKRNRKEWSIFEFKVTLLFLRIVK